ncbi:MAG TPA: ABC transporter ATP-binding protein, partial [Alphaproteobacteria bacterium]|nr:ABC transporter ATP-binding protein [Alphaproteobacteria bacterium]
GYLSDDFGLYEELTVKDVLEYMAGCHELPIKDSVDTVIKRLKIESVQDKKCGALSRGWKQRVGIAMAVIHMPEVLILDEPASGLDPEARSELSTILKDLQKEGMTILVSSHILSELEEYSTAMLVLRDGKIKDHITLEQQKALTSISSVHIGLSSPVTPAQKIHLENLSQDKKISVTENRHTVTIQHKNEPEQLNILLKSLLDENIPVCSFTPSQSTLQTLYLEIAQTDKNQDK